MVGLHNAGTGSVDTPPTSVADHRRVPPEGVNARGFATRYENRV
jgi:hypothetical protein